MGMVGKLITRRILFLVFLLATAGICSGEDKNAVQFFLKTDEQGICGGEAEVAVFALDSYGLIDKNYRGIKPVKIMVKEIAGKSPNSFSSAPESLEFIDGRALFVITDSEPEALEISLSAGDNITPFPVKTIFKRRIIPERLQIKLAARGNINQPQKAVVMAVDKKGDIALDFNGKGFLARVEEQIKDNSFNLEPQDLEIFKGKTAFVISDSQEEELTIKISDPKGVLQTAEARIAFAAPDNEPPQITEIKMESLAFVILTFNEELDDAAATDANNYEVVCSGSQRPRDVEFHNNKVILELDDLLRSRDQMYVVVKNIKDLSGNSAALGTRSANYEVPYIPLHLELRPSATSTAVNNSITVSLTARCISGRVPQFINNKFKLEVSEAVSDGSARLSNSELQMQKGIGEFSIIDSAAEKVRVTISDPEGAVEPATLELEFI